MFEINISSKRLTIPENVSEITLGQFIRLRDSSEIDNLERLSIICNTSKKDLASLEWSSKAYKQLNDAIALTTHLNQSIEELFNTDQKLITPNSVIILGKVIKIPKDLEKQPFWPSRKVKEILQEQVEATGKGEAFDPTDKIADVLAHYLYVPFTELTYNEYRAEEFKEAVYDLPLSQAVALANFFFLQWKPLYLTKTNSLLTSLLIWKKRLVLKCSRFMKTSMS